MHHTKLRARLLKWVNPDRIEPRENAWLGFATCQSIDRASTCIFIYVIPLCSFLVCGEAVMTDLWRLTATEGVAKLRKWDFLRWNWWRRQPRASRP
jgi:hypothetical protein